MDQSPPRQTLPHVPRLSISNLLALTACIAAVLAVLRWSVHSVDAEKIPKSSDQLIMLMAFGCMVGCTVFGAALIAWHELRGMLWPLEPGEYLVLVAAAMLSVATAAWITVGFIHDLQRRQNPNEALGLGVIGEVLRWLSWSTASSEAAMALPCAVAALAQRRRPIWSAMLWGATVCLVLSCIIELAGLYGWPTIRVAATAMLYVCAPAILALLVAAVIGDWRRREPRHWLHWSGVAIAGLLIAWPVFLLIMSLLA